MPKYFPKIPKSFGAEWYFNKYPDVKKDPYYGKHAWEHFVKHGLEEGREYAPDVIGPPSPPPDPGSDSPYFDFFGQRKFLVFVSYFDGIRAKYLEQDLNYLKSKGVDGIRLYLNFSYPPNRPWKFLFRSDGSLDVQRLGMLGHILRLANEREMVVDISSSRRLDGVDGRPNGWQMAPGVYAHAWRLLSIELKKWGFQNFLIDEDNEGNCPWANRSATLTIPEAIVIREVIQANLPTVPITASAACNISPEAAAVMTKAEGMSFIGYHDPRVRGWAEATEGLALRCKRAVGSDKIKVCFQEPNGIGKAGSVQSANDFWVALNGARKAKVASWTLHTSAGFSLRKRSFFSQLHPVENEFLNGLEQRR